jgi:hypothetical protein
MTSTSPEVPTPRSRSGPLDELVSSEEPAGEAVNHRAIADGLLDGDLPREGGEVAVANLHLHSARGEAALLHARGNLVCLLAQTLSKSGSMGGVSQKGVFAADALHIIAELERAIILAHGHALEVAGPRANIRPEVAGIGLEICDGADAGLMQSLLGYLPHAVESSDGQGAEEDVFLALQHEGESIRLEVGRGDLCEQFVGARCRRWQ